MSAKEDTKKRLSKAEEELQLVNEKLKEIEEQSDAAMVEMRDRINGELQNKLSNVHDSFRQNFDTRMHDMAARYSDHIKSATANKSHDVLRANRVIREVSRELSEDWVYIFRYLMSTFDKAEVDAEVERIKKVIKPFMQPYEALNIWRELKGDSFDIQQLVTALKDNAQHDLARKAEDILRMNIDSLMAMGPLGGGIKSTRTKQDNSENGSQGTPNESNNNYTGFEEVISDKTLLHLSKKLSKTWQKVGKKLELEDDEIENINRVEGDSYHGAFKMLFSWRSTAPYSEEAKEKLCVALKKVGQGELCNIVNGK